MAALHLELTFRSPLKESQTDELDWEDWCNKKTWIYGCLIDSLLGFPPDALGFNQCVVFLSESCCCFFSMRSGLRAVDVMEKKDVNSELTCSVKTEDRLYIFSIRFDLQDQKVWKCDGKLRLLPPLLQKTYWHSEDAGRNNGKLMRQTLYLTCHVWVWIMSSIWQIAKHSSPSAPSGQRRTRIRPALTFILLYTTSLLYGPELWGSASRSNQPALELYFSPLLPLALSFIIIKVRFMSPSLGEVTQHSEVQLSADSIYQRKATVATKEPERTLPGSESS